MKFDDVIGILRKHPGTLGLDGSFGQATAFLLGLDAGNDGCLLVGFREWLVVRLGDGANLGWPALVAHLATPQGPDLRVLRALSGEDNLRLVRTMCDLLDEFLLERSQADGLLKIFDRYLKWLRAQEWYGPASPSYLDLPGDE
jgi:hypothetical protein